MSTATGRPLLETRPLRRAALVSLVGTELLPAAAMATGSRVHSAATAAVARRMATATAAAATSRHTL